MWTGGGRSGAGVAADVSAGTLSVVAGICGSPGAPTDGPATQSRLGRIAGLAADPAGKALYLADPDNHLVERLDLTSGRLTRFAGTGQAPTAPATDGHARQRAITPTAVVVDRSTNVYLLDAASPTVLRIANAGPAPTQAPKVTRSWDPACATVFSTDDLSVRVQTRRGERGPWTSHEVTHEFGRGIEYGHFYTVEVCRSADADWNERYEVRLANGTGASPVGILTFPPPPRTGRRDPLLWRERNAALDTSTDPATITGPVQRTKAAYRALSWHLAPPPDHLGTGRMLITHAVTLEANTLFAEGTTTLTAEGRAILRDLVPRLARTDAVRCEGYTDYTRPPTEARTRSQAMARTVCAALRADRRLRLNTTDPIGLAAARPVLIGGTLTDRAGNERVVVQATTTGRPRW